MHCKTTQPSFDRIRGKFSVRSDIEQIRLLHLELLQLPCQPSSRFPLPLLLHSEGFVHMALHLGREAGIEGEPTHFASNGALKVLDREVREIARSILTTATQEVSIDSTFSVVRFGVDHAALSPRFVTPIAAHQAPQEVRMHLVSLGWPLANGEHLLDAFEGLR
ncbi:hypothetical protein RWH45_10350 [Microbacterium sp. KSW4-17]|uniref:Uncharacterized protein n=1 Tax=Microbacterium galbum TaxID=3075994 RepID=A0ABU3T8C5_9MICO|nr:hypothetical protein [Microbacterium sp. KSW4-17]MDU0367618.1 hypothetical protein [Microbacterium sp. KSW4-17]